ncbi:FAD-dependent monooxygenase [Pyxidicoccus xibeiensis]|uniref:FAD-dependent monooxygenase n=1 Tax=Pyxidicoccus xibeiensis TaxID=2906759 RepID=UPI0020A71ADB|nr:FAD-dependent monooxygenase [Pyxidicoccus xibeiensis]MCP3144495.1 FAD-dependent monooxygenase [Pyxidicoccus xibeiensis]
MTSQPPRHVLIAGAGIGGLTLACALRRAGLSATVFERADALRWVGAGIIVQMNAAVALRRIGLADAVAAAGASPTDSAILRPSGAAITRLPVQRLQQELGVPMTCIHRARLQAVLLEHAGPEHVRLGRAVAGFTDDGQGITVTLSDGSFVKGDVLVGADGLRSAVRSGLLGDAPLRYSGYTSWRGVSPEVPGARPGHVSETWGRGARFGVVPIGSGQVYWYATLNAPAGGQDAPGEARARLRDVFGGWHAPIADLLAATPDDAIVRTDIHDRPPMDRWSRGRVTLLGDAAHPMTPNLGQGGCQAIEDAVVLAECLARGGAVEEALAAYEARRRERANAIVARSWSLGRLAQLESPVGRFMRDSLFWLVPSALAARGVRDLVRSAS